MRRLLIASIAAVTIGAGPAGQQRAAPTLTSTEVMIPMRDGTRLFAQIYKPVNGRGALCADLQPRDGRRAAADRVSAHALRRRAQHAGRRGGGARRFTRGWLR